jgi:hypothetical protein
MQSSCWLEASPRCLAGALQDVDPRFFDIRVGRPFDADDVVPRALGCHDQLVKLQLQGQRVAVLRRLDQKDHQKRHDCRAGIDDELPRCR